LVPEKLHWEFSTAQKVQAAVTVKEAEDSALEIYPLLNALALTVAPLVKVIAPV